MKHRYIVVVHFLEHYILCLINQTTPFSHSLIVKDTTGKYNDEFLFTTHLSLLPSNILDFMAGRWSIEVSHRNSKQFLGISHPQNRNTESVKRQIPFGFLIMSLVMLWYAKIGHNSRYDVRLKTPWYHQKLIPSFIDMLAALRRSLWAEIFFVNSTSKVERQKIPEVFNPNFAQKEQNSDSKNYNQISNSLKFLIQIASMTA